MTAPVLPRSAAAPRDPRIGRGLAMRLAAGEYARCAQLLRVLVESGFLCRYSDGGYGRCSDGVVNLPAFQSDAGRRRITAA